MNIGIYGRKALNTASAAMIGSAIFIDEKFLVNKAVVDASADIPMIYMANNKTERKERFNRAAMVGLSRFFHLF